MIWRGTSATDAGDPHRYSVPKSYETNVGAAVCFITSEGWKRQHSFKDLWTFKICLPWSWCPETWLPHETHIYSLSNTQRAGSLNYWFYREAFSALLCMTIYISHSIEPSADLCQSHSPEPRLSHEVATVRLCSGMVWRWEDAGISDPQSSKSTANKTLLKMAPEYSTLRICWVRQ